MSSHHQKYINNTRWRRFRIHILQRDGHKCRKCGRRGGRFEVHHLVGLADGGAIFDPDNCITWCRDCHQEYTAEQNRKPIPPEVQDWIDFVDELAV